MKSARSKHSYRGWQVIMLVLLLVGFFPVQAESFLAGIEPTPDKPIPRQPYTSWSLFLICNPTWLQQENEKSLQDLYNHFLTFSRVTGPNHLAVWFWERSSRRKRSVLRNDVDANRNSQYCEKFKLLPSQSPHILVTTMYPDLVGLSMEDKVVLALGGLPANDIGFLLTIVTNQLLVQGLNQTKLDSEAYWRTGQRSFETIYEGGAWFLKHVKITIDAKLVKVAIGGEVK